MKIDVAALREEYSGADLDVSSAEESPFAQFKKWFEEEVSGDLLEPNAMVLSTQGEQFPDQRTVLMKAYDEKGTGSHVWEDHFFPEVVDPKTGESLPEGEDGVLVFTTLTKEAFPVIFD